MQRWDYLVVTAICRDKGDNTMELAADINGQRVWGLQEIFQYCGRQGWELVSYVPAEWNEQAVTGDPQVVIGVDAVFKRPLDD